MNANLTCKKNRTHAIEGVFDLGSVKDTEEKSFYGSSTRSISENT